MASDWQREECLTNLYLFICGIACALDDHLAGRTPDLRRVPQSTLFSEFTGGARGAFSSAASWLRTAFESRSLVPWKQRWDDCLDRVSHMLAQRSQPADSQFAAFRRAVKNLSDCELPGRLLLAPAHIPESFRSQHVTHREVFAMADTFLALNPDRNQPLLVVGVRTAGAYFAPLIKARLELREWPVVDWVNVVPGQKLSPSEKHHLRQLCCSEVRVLIVDDHPQSSPGLPLVLDLVKRYGAETERISLLLYESPARPAAAPLPEDIGDGERCTLIRADPHTEKLALLRPPEIQRLLRQHYHSQGWERVHISDSPEADRLNEKLWRQCRDTSHAGLQRIVEVQLSKDDVPPVTKWVLAHSAGWGWLGYHGYLPSAMPGAPAPHVIGQSEGILFTEWPAGNDSWPQLPGFMGAVARPHPVEQPSPNLLAA